MSIRRIFPYALFVYKRLAFAQITICMCKREMKVTYLVCLLHSKAFAVSLWLVLHNKQCGRRKDGADPKRAILFLCKDRLMERFVELYFPALLKATIAE